MAIARVDRRFEFGRRGAARIRYWLGVALMHEISGYCGGECRVDPALPCAGHPIVALPLHDRF
jgi:hypothetical protein